jgi:broad specificity phosphatase PhoE
MGRLLLVRHGQASWDAEDYDVLSTVGWEQSRLLGRALAARGTAPDLVVRGGMRRHRETTEAVLEPLERPVPVEVDEGWDEFDHVAMLAAHPRPFEGRRPSKEEFQAWFETATDRWTGGGHDHEYAESFAAFTDRVGEALRRTAERAAERATGTVLVVTSGGPVAWATASLLADEPDVRGRLWRRLNPVCVNSGVTRVVTGRRGLTLVGFNDQAHLDGMEGVLTYR